MEEEGNTTDIAGIHPFAYISTVSPGPWAWAIKMPVKTGILNSKPGPFQPIFHTLARVIFDNDKPNYVSPQLKTLF